MSAVRQHYKLATTGKPGQTTGGKGAAKSGGKSEKSSVSDAKQSGKGSAGKKSGY